MVVGRESYVVVVNGQSNSFSSCVVVREVRLESGFECMSQEGNGDAAMFKAR